MLIIFLLIAQSSCQFVSYLSLRLRLPGRCREGDFDCGFGHCVPARKFHDGRADCMDGSDEWCMFGQVRCGAYCVDFRDSFGCLFNSKCDGSSRQPKFCEHSKEKLCREPTAFPCKGYGECITWDCLLDGKRNCIDGSDEDVEYVRSLEGPLRCYFNRTELPQPVAVKYPRPSPPPTLAPLPMFPPPPPCSQCVPAPFTMPLPNFTTRPASPFPTLINVQTPGTQAPQYPNIPSAPASITRPPSVQFKHITPEIRQPEPEYGDFFPTAISDVRPPNQVFPTKIDVPVQAQIKTVLPKISSPATTSVETTSSPMETTQNGLAHIKVVETVETGGSEAQTHINIGTGEIKTGAEGKSGSSSGGATHIDISTGDVRKEGGQQQVSSEQKLEHSFSTLPHTISFESTTSSSVESVEGKADEMFFGTGSFANTPQPAAAIKPVTPKISYTIHPIIPVPVTSARFGKPDYNVFGPQGLIPIRPGIAVPSSVPDFWMETTPRNPFIPGEGAVGENIGQPEKPWNRFTVPTVKIGLVTPASVTTTSGGTGERTTPETTVTTSTKTPQTSESHIPKVTSTETSSKEESAEKSTIKSVSTADVQEKCLKDLLEYVREKHPNPYCTCDIGMMQGDSGCDETEVTTFRVKMDSFCGGKKNDLSGEDEARIALTKIKDSIPREACISPETDEEIVVNLNCGNCTLSYVQDLLQRRKKDVKDLLPSISAEGLNSSLCEYSSFNYCHKFAVCTVDPSGVRYQCHCKAGTKDVSHGKGRDCFGFPEEDDCIKLFDICLIVWLLFLFGFLFCCPLLCYLCHHLCRYYKQNAIHPISLTVPKVQVRNNGVQGREQGMVMASVLVDALKNNAKGISAVSRTMAKSEATNADQEFQPAPINVPVMKKPEQLPVTIISPIPTPASQRSTPDSAKGTPSPVSETPARISPEIRSEQATPSNETPILEQMKSGDAKILITPGDSTSVRSLPIPSTGREGEHLRAKTSMDVGKVSGEPNGRPSSPSFHPPSGNTTIVTAEVHHENIPVENAHDLRSIGVQPTIWETYRAVGLPTTQERQDSSSSLDSLIGKKFLLPKNGVVPVKEKKTTEIQIISNLVPPLQFNVSGVTDAATIETQKSDTHEAVTPPTEIVAAQAEVKDRETPIEEGKSPSPEHSETMLRSKSTSGSKLAEMLGVTLDDTNDMQALNDMADRKIELPLSPSGEMENFDLGVTLTTHPDLQPVLPTTSVEPEDLAAVLKKEEIRIKEEEAAEKKKTEVFVPKAVRDKKSPSSKRKSKFLAVPSRGDGGSSTEESDPEVAFYKKMQALKRAGRQGNPFPDRKRRYRKPERQLSSISEKSAEIASDAAIAATEPSIRDFTVSAPNTTRSLSDWHAFIPRHRRFDTGDDTDVDIPTKTKQKPFISSPEIPDVSLSRSQTRLNLLQKQEDETKKMKRQTSKSSLASRTSGRSVKESKPTGSRPKPFLPEISKKPGTSKSQAVSEPRSHRPSLISRKIATRKTEMRSSKSASDLTLERQETITRSGLLSKREKIARSEEFLTGLPRWDSSPYKEGEKQELPPIHHRSTYSLRSVHVSPTRLGNRLGSSHSLMTGRSGSSLSLSPYFDPREGSKPPKEELWWTTPRD